MALDKQGINIPFGQGIDTKTDPKQVVAGKLLSLSNVVFNNGGELQKRNGFAKLSQIPETDATTLTTANNNLVATGINLYAFHDDTAEWLNKGLVQPVNLNVQPVVRNSLSQTVVDSITASNGSIFTVFTDSSGTYYQIYNQTLVTRQALPGDAKHPRTLILGRFFIVTFVQTVTATPHLRYIAIPISNPTAPGTVTDISTQVSSVNAAYDAVVSNSIMYITWDASDIGNAIRTTSINDRLIQTTTVVLSTQKADNISITVDTTGSTGVVWVSWWTSGTTTGKSAAYNQNLLAVLAPTVTYTSTTITHLSSIASNGVLTFYYEINKNYSYESVRSDFIKKNTITQAGSVGTSSVVLRSVGLASKPFYVNTRTYMLVVYAGSLQPTYFLTTDAGEIIMKLAYSNASGYLTSFVLPTASLNNGVYNLPYLFRDQLSAVNKTQGVANVNGIYTQTGVNIANFVINSAQQHSSDIAGALHLTGGMIWEYDQVQRVEHSFHVWPEDILVSTDTSGGTISAQQYFYAVTYEWTDAAGQLHRSSPSIPYSITTTGATSSNTLDIPTLRLTYKSDVRIVIYRWSVAQQIYYQVTSITSPLLSDPTIDSVQYVDTVPDSAILGNTILYTTGGVVENIAAPASDLSTLFKSRMFVVDSEDKNLLWYSKQIIEQTPVEFSDLFTLYVAPTTGAQGSTGPITALSAMDDKLIIFKKDAIYYLTGAGPDNTGANNDFQDAVFITATAGCANQNSVVFTPLGVMFQSDKGIWLLSRDLGTQYIGADVQAFTDVATVNSAVSVPGTNQVRFVLSNGVTLMYDYYYAQWGTFTGIPAISSTLYQGMHTLLNSNNLVLQESAGQFLDYTTPVLIGLTTAWIKLTGLQGFQRAYYFFILGSFISAHKLSVSIAYDYNPSPEQNVVITPINQQTTWGSDNSWGSNENWGGGDLLEQWRVFINKQKCQAIQITINELQGAQQGTGLTLSGLNFVIGAKKGYPKLSAKQSVG